MTKEKKVIIIENKLQKIKKRIFYISLILLITIIISIAIILICVYKKEKEINIPKLDLSKLTLNKNYESDKLITALITGSQLYIELDQYNIENMQNILIHLFNTLLDNLNNLEIYIDNPIDIKITAHVKYNKNYTKYLKNIYKNIDFRYNERTDLKNREYFNICVLFKHKVTNLNYELLSNNKIKIQYEINNKKIE